jgi:valyl-tRNA synthetase
VLVEVLDRLLRLLHPFMPFLTEELSQSLPGARGLLPVASFPGRVAAWEDPDAEALAERLLDLDTGVRNVRARAGIPPGARIRLWLIAPDPETARALMEHRAMVEVPVRASQAEILASIPDGIAAARGIGGGIPFAIPLEGVLDLAAERERLTREIEKARSEREPHARKVESAEFLERAPERIIERTRQIVRDFDTRIAHLTETLGLLGTG